MSGGTSPFALEMSPVMQAASRTAHVTVSDHGTTTIKVSANVKSLHGHCTLGPANGVTVTPTRFTLAPGHSVVTTVRIPTGVPASDYAVIYGGQAAGHGNFHLTGAVASQVLVHAGSCTGQHVAAVAPSSGGFPIVWLVVGLIALVVAAVGCGMWLRRRA